MHQRSYIHKLSNDILVYIFRLLTTPFTMSVADERVGVCDCYVPPTKSWLPVAGVCRRWRALALTSQLLWSTINIGAGPMWFYLCLARAGPTAPLAVRMRTTSPSTAGAALRLFLYHSARLRTLVIVGMGDVLRLLGVVIERGNLAGLEELCVDVKGSQAAGMGLEEVLGMNPTGFNEFLPALRTLRLEGTSPPWGAREFMGRLKTLSVCHVHPRKWMTLAQTLEALGACVALEELLLIRSLPFTTWFEEDDFIVRVRICELDAGNPTTVELPNLRVARIEGRTPAGRVESEVLHLLRYLHPPPSADIHLFLELHPEISRSYCALFPWDDKTALERFPILRTATHADWMNDQGFGLHHGVVGGGPKVGSQFWLHISREAGEHDENGELLDDDRLEEFCEAVRQAPLKSLTLFGGPSLEAFASAFAALPKSLEWLTIQFGQLSEDYMDESSDSDRKDEDVQAVSPSESEQIAAKQRIGRSRLRSFLGALGPPAGQQTDCPEAEREIHFPKLQELQLNSFFWYDGMPQDIEEHMKNRASLGAAPVRVALNLCKNVMSSETECKRQEQDLVNLSQSGCLEVTVKWLT